ncbi:hypothetical protein [Petrimonas sp.]|uniref:hypothetical protein n=1 Tax=Petrimonas sp. TaxID=2023866 RepID=UPI003F513416
MKKYRDYKALYVYNLSLRNEIYLTGHLIKMTGLDTIVDRYILWPTVMKEYLLKYPFLIKKIYSTISCCWYLVNFLLVSIQFFTALLNKLVVKKININIERILVDLTHLLLNRVEQVENETPKYLITFNKTIKRENIVAYSFYNFLSFTDLLLVYRLSLVSYFSASRVIKDRLQLPQTYSNFKWFLVWISINNLNPKEIWFANHCDRWAVLLDNIGVKSTLLQHGIEDGALVPPIKLRSISSLYIFDKEQVDYFKRKIIVSNFNYHIYKSSLRLSKLINNSNKNILIIGNISCYKDTEFKLIKMLQNSPINIIVKPHPVLPISDYLKLSKHYSFTLIKEKDTFPLVDFVVSYNSTLAYEYKANNIPVLFYEEYTIKEIFEKITNA